MSGIYKGQSLAEAGRRKRMEADTNCGHTTKRVCFCRHGKAVYQIGVPKGSLKTSGEEWTVGESAAGRKTETQARCK
jgi:hypothetical protein